MKKKILMVAMFPPPYSSGERMVNKTVEQLLNEKYDTTVINISTGKLNADKPGLSRIINQFASIWLYLKAVIKIIFKVKKGTYHAFYFVSPSSSFGHIRDYVMISFAGRKIHNIYAFIHNGDYDKVLKKSIHKNLTASFIKRVTKFIFLSNNLLELSAAVIPEEKCIIIRNSIDPSIIFSDTEIEKKIAAKKAGFLNIFYISNMTPSKGYMDLAEAVLLLKKKGAIQYNFTVHFIGEWLSDNQLNEFKIFLEKNDLKETVKIHGKIHDRKIIKQFLTEADVFVLPTYFPKEAQPLCILEALNAGTPVITTRHASIPEYITDNYNGLFVEKQCPQQIAEAIEKLRDTEVWRNMAKAARESFLENFSMPVYKTKLFDLFEN